MDLILVLQSLFLYFRSYTCITELILVFRILFLYFGSYTCIAELILILQNLYLYYRYGSTRRYYRNFTCTKVSVGTTELVLVLRILYLFKYFSRIIFFLFLFAFQFVISHMAIEVDIHDIFSW